METNQKEKEYVEEDPPILNSWKNIYSLVLAALATLILIFYYLTVTLS